MTRNIIEKLKHHKEAQAHISQTELIGIGVKVSVYTFILYVFSLYH